MKSLPWKHRNNKLLYYWKGFLREILPSSFFQSQLSSKLLKTSHYDLDYIRCRINYYNKLSLPFSLPKHTQSLKVFKLPRKLKVYYFDAYEYTRYFNKTLLINFLFGDIIIVPDIPSIVKSRPIQDENENSVLLKLNKIRHFNYTNDSKNFTDKQNKLIGRSVVRLENRVRFHEMYFDHPLCDIGQTNQGTKHDRWIKEKLTIDEHLDYKFILCLEGNDVASNLKWVMSSNSLAVMPKPKFETWFMEGTLIPDYHYICIKDDYSDLEERLQYYINNTDAALVILQNAHQYVNQFKDSKREDLISLLVLEKYFYKTGQIAKRYHSLYD
jgi:hypothetical protein